jgi:hypothetical protein
MKLNDKFFDSFNDKELMEIIASAQHELEFRRSKKENELWDKVVAAVQEYTNEIGPIDIEVKNFPEYMYFTADFDASLPGCIYAKE